MDDPAQVMQQPQSPAQPTILRIKRKRTDEPLDALVVESRSRRKKSRGGSGFFQFAETVEEETFWHDPGLTKDLRTRISTLASGEFAPDKSAPASEAKSAPASEAKSAPETPSRRYTIVRKDAEPRAPAPPLVHTASDTLKEPLHDDDEEDFTMYDAVPEPRAELPPDAEMEKFLPMLQEYLRMNDEPANVGTSARVGTDEGAEYVWDVFYHRPAITDWAAAANIATVTGLPPAGPYDSDSDSDSAGDEDDEDSNTEDFYRNDYPDEPDHDSSSSASDEEYPEVSDDEDERDLDAFLAWRARR